MQAALELQPAGTTDFDATDTRPSRGVLPRSTDPVDHVVLTVGSPFCMPLADMDLAEARHHLGERLDMNLAAAIYSRDKVRPEGTRCSSVARARATPRLGLTVASTLTTALPALTANLALELAPIRVNLIAAGFVDTPLSASLLDDQLEARREELRAALPVRRFVGPEDAAALTTDIMCNDAFAGATYDIDGGEQLLAH
ncbi:SDR family oxidoreductase [Streptomyces sp. NPDC007206]|uniref:SDR family oxidoreductase n=1 Tax=Streptomyces sp. NPDC007206 TaxID=3154317 RepID=UPI0033E03EB8